MSGFNRTIDGTTLCFAPEGAITANNAQQLRDEINESLEGMDEVVFDLANLKYISSAGLRVLLATQKALAGRGGVCVKNASDEVREVFDVTKMSTFIRVEGK